MASPFRIFRKHQKIMIAVLGILAMIAFVFLDPLIGALGGGGGGPEDREVVSTSYQTLHESDLQRMLQTRRILNEFLWQAYMLGGSAGGRPTAFPLLRQNAQVTEEMVVRQMLLARRAEELGFRVNDTAINRYLKQLTGSAVSADQLRDIVRGARVGQREVNMDFIFDALREALLAAELQETYETAVAVTPAQSWEYFTRLNDRVTAEVLPVEVAQFVDQVSEPSDAELQTFYAAHREQYALPNSPEPGFRQPPQAAFGYVKADFEQMVERIAAEIPQEEVAQYYEDNKRQFVRPQLLGEDEPAAETPAPEAPPTETAPAASATPALPEVPAAPTDEAPATETAPEQPAAEPQSQSPTAPPAEETDTTPAPQAPAADENSQTLVVEQPQFVALLQAEGTAPAQPEPAQAEPAQTEAPQAEQPQAEQAQTAAQPAAEAAPATGETAPATPATTSESPAQPAADEVQYYPLEEVAGDIRRELARQRAAEQVQQVLQPLGSELNTYARELIGWELAQAENEAEGTAQPKPAPPDAKLKQMAQQAGLEYGQTKEVDFFELQDTPLGQATVASIGQPFASYAFLAQIGEYRPTVAIGDDGSGYLIWKTSEQEDRIPALEEIREEVVRAWKLVRARELAQEQAKQLAQQAEQADKPLAEVFPQREVKRVGPFSWLTLGAVPQQMGGQPQARLSEVEGVENAGPDFMEQVFALDEGEVGVAMNQPETIAYVIRLASHAATREALRERFLSEPGPWQQMALMQNRQQVILALNEELVKRAEVEWHRPPDTSGNQ